MFNIRGCRPWAASLLAASAALVGCAPKTDVSTTGNVPARYSHVYLSVQEIWFNTSASAGPGDTTWIKYPLSTPVTFDLAASLDGTLSSLTTGLAVPIGTYAQVRLIPVDPGSPLLSSAQSLGALYNSEVDYVDSANTSQQVPLELQNPERGIGIQTSISVKGTATNVFSSSSTSNSPSTTDSTTSSPTDSTTNSTTGSTTSAATGNSTSSSGSSSSAPFSLDINFDGAKDVVPFTYGTTNAMLLNPHATAYDTSQVGAIQGTLSIGSLTGISSPSTSTYVDIQVTAESLSADGTRHVMVNSAPVRSDGTFTLYPLATTSSSPTSYDLVIHGPAIATIIVKGVTVNVGAPSSSTPVNIGTITPRAASSFTVNLNAATPLQAGALVGFYQTLPGSNEVPYVIEERPIDPFSRTFSSDQAVSSANIDYGTFSSGSNVALSTADPVEGAATYRVAASAPLFADGVLTTTLTAPSGHATTAALVSVPTLSVASGAVPNTTTVTVSQVTANKYDRGDVIISHDGAIVATAPLDSALAGSGASSLAITGLPSGGGSAGLFDGALYYVSVRAWSSANPTGTLTRETYPVALDLRNSSIGTYSVTIN